MIEKQDLSKGTVRIAIDPGYTNLGYAVSYDTQLLQYGTFYFKDDDRLQEIYYAIKDLFIGYKPNEVLVEEFRIYKRAPLRGADKTAFAFGVTCAVVFEFGAALKVVNYNNWSSQFKKTYKLIEDNLAINWKEALEQGSEHSRDAVKMLLPATIKGIHIYK